MKFTKNQFIWLAVLFFSCFLIYTCLLYTSKNYAYNLSYQLLVIVLPIITTPYVTRIFSSKDLGTYG